ncbi:hypothetical protein A7X67_02940 [Clostridium sp. W14A]|uniref:Uncharacterized protein n=1 Tax=Caproicibacter fermentans TaxID=2576756 RepID=A0A7G8T9Z2_9FIRM|nr:hypothetical protein [Caproicibacter fermentans]OCN02829.1 hypothetical protein A7X67_02940 [Clostridium sp. W14A]QNK40433.1 hypothetical protein HCR03_17585 [Caproicibacter fermentans]
MKEFSGKGSRVRKPFQTAAAFVVILALFLTSSVGAFAAASEQSPLPNGLLVGKWMLQSDGQTVADYLGQTYSKYGDKKVQEMINFIYVDPYATSSENANDRFFAAISNSDPSFSKSSMHSGGYTGYLQNRLFRQKPDGEFTAYVDKGFLHQNIHHFRTFGATFYQKAWYITAAASTEDYNWLKFTHTFDSFNTARDVLANALLRSQANPGFRRLPDVDLHNKILQDDANLTTADFDGVTVCVQASEKIHPNS